MNDMRTDVIIAGAGPAGVVAALHLAQAGVRVTLPEAAPAVAMNLRAATFHPPTLDHLRTLGVTDELHRTGLRAPEHGYINRRGGTQVRFDLSELADITGHPCRLHSEQWKLARHFCQILATMPNAEVRRCFQEVGCEVVRNLCLHCSSWTALASIPGAAIRDTFRQLGNDADAIVQAGVNLGAAEPCAAAEPGLGKPVIAINATIYWHALCVNGLADRIAGHGWLLEGF